MNSLKNCSGQHFQMLRSGKVLTKKKLAITAFLALAIYSCGPSYEEKVVLERDAEIADSVLKNNAGIVTDKIGGVARNFIRTADMKLSVSGVLKTMQKIEDLVKQNDGFVTRSELLSEINHHETVQWTTDSVKEIKQHTTIGYVTFRVPNKSLDTVLRCIANMANFVDYSILTSDDVKLKLYANLLAENRNARFSDKVESAAKQSDSKIKQVTGTYEKALEKQTLADEKSLESFDLADQVNFSTVKLQLYQAPSSFVQTFPIQAQIKPYESPYSNKLAVAFESGFQMIKKFVLFVVGSWGLIAIIGLVLYAALKLFQFLNKEVLPVRKEH